MNIEEASYYVYVYIDPRNFEEFYYGKGKGKRKEAHLRDGSDSVKAKRIQEIKKAGLTPIIRVIAKGLTEKEAFLVEKTLLWKLGKSLTNVSKGQLKAHFRPQNTMYRDLQGFDFRNEIYYVNVGEGPHRNWDDCKKFSFISAGGGVRFTDPIKSLEPGDVVVAYLKSHGYVGIGLVTETAVRVSDFMFRGKSLRDFSLKAPKMFENENNQKAEFVVSTKWKKAVRREDAKWAKNEGLFTTQKIKASLKSQEKTIRFLERSFRIKFSDFLKA